MGRGSSSYCQDCVRERKEARLAKRKLRRRDQTGYPVGFHKRRKQLTLEAVERQCVISLISSVEHKQKFGTDLELHHVIMARVAQEFGDANAEWNMVWLSAEKHALMKAADEALMRNDWLSWVSENRRIGLPDVYMKRTLDGFGIGWNRLPL
jgi:hypothetical protein